MTKQKRTHKTAKVLLSLAVAGALVGSVFAGCSAGKSDKGNKNAIGYVSLGSLNDTVQALTIDGTEPTAENVKNGSYKISRPFNIVTKDDLSPAAKDFINYIQSADGQKIIEDNHYVSRSNTGAFKSSGAKGKVLAKYYEEFYYSDIVEGIGTAYTKLPLFRSDEMLLARAEANTMLGKFDEALDDLNCFIELRIPADDFDIATTSLTQAKILSYYSAQLNGANTFINSDFNKGRFLDGEQGRLQKALILTILDFRRIEFLYEGQRYYDILRWNIPVTHRDNSGQTSTLTPDDDRRILQIPQTAILAGVEANPMNNIPQPW